MCFSYPTEGDAPRSQAIDRWGYYCVVGVPEIIEAHIVSDCKVTGIYILCIYRERERERDGECAGQPITDVKQDLVTEHANQFLTDMNDMGLRRLRSCDRRDEREASQ